MSGRAALARARLHRTVSLFVVMTTTVLCVPATAHAAYTLRPVAFLGDPAPGGGTFINDFEPSAINIHGNLAFTADVSTGGEGVFTTDGTHITQLLRSGMAAPGGVTLDYAGELGRMAFDNAGDVGIPFTVAPFGPTGLPSAVFRFTRRTSTLSAVAVPGTPMPDSGPFAGTWFNIGMNNRGVIAINGLARGSDINRHELPGLDGKAGGIWLSYPDGTLKRGILPGDPAPEGRVFDDAWDPTLNDAGDMAFGAHVIGDRCYPQDPPAPYVCTESLYLRYANGKTRSIAHQGAPAPGGGTFYIAFGGVINNHDEIAFIGSLTSPSQGPIDDAGVFLWRDGHIIAIAHPGDAMPGGGHMRTAGEQAETYGLNDKGDVSFVAALDSTNHGDPDMGAYVWSHGRTHLVARTGTVIPGVGTIRFFGYATDTVPFQLTGGAINSREQIVLAATLTNGRTALLVASPSH